MSREEVLLKETTGIPRHGEDPESIMAGWGEGGGGPEKCLFFVLSL